MNGVEVCMWTRLNPQFQSFKDSSKHEILGENYTSKWVKKTTQTVFENNLDDFFYYFFIFRFADCIFMTEHLCYKLEAGSLKGLGIY